MRAALILTLAFASLCGCERTSKGAAGTTSVSDVGESKIPMIRMISFNDTNGDFGIELNGDRAFLRQDWKNHPRTEISYRDGLNLLEGFYAIPRIEDYRGKKSDNRQTSIQYLVVIHDEMPKHYSDEWVDYVIPKDSVALHPELNAWFEGMRTIRKSADTEQTGAGQPATRSELKSDDSRNANRETEGRSR